MKIYLNKLFKRKVFLLPPYRSSSILQILSKFILVLRCTPSHLFIVKWSPHKQLTLQMSCFLLLRGLLSYIPSVTYDPRYLPPHSRGVEGGCRGGCVHKAGMLWAKLRCSRFVNQLRTMRQGCERNIIKVKGSLCISQRQQEGRAIQPLLDGALACVTAIACPIIVPNT